MTQRASEPCIAAGQALLVVSGCFGPIAGLGRRTEKSDDDSDDHQVEEHLDADDDASQFTLGGDVAKAHRGEDGDRQVQGSGVVEGSLKCAAEPWASER